MAVVAIAIKLESPGPVFIYERRLTRSGRRITLLKFRVHYLPRSGSYRVWRREPTQIGKFLVATRTCYLPQLLNVLRGEMSFVGADADRPDLLDSA
jgi:lipopolysaccharide/colanic/teichoic acid biosynthesis glycosyltransferase